MHKILMVDDDEALRLLYSDELMEEGYDVLTSGNVSRIMDLIDQNSPDLLVMEAQLNGSNRLELLQEIKNAYPDLPVILCTAYPAYISDIKSVAAEDYVVKSSSLAELKDKIEKVMYMN